MRATRFSIALISLMLSLPAWAVKLIDASPPPPMPDIPLEEDGTPQKPALIEVASRGKLLYENHCMACHESVAQIRVNRRVKALPALQAQVIRWAAYSKLPWGNEEIEDVVQYLDTQYYKFEK